MNLENTSLAGQTRGFPDTTWGVLSQLQATPTASHREGLETLSRRYWRPVYCYLRLRWGKSNEDAKDLTQAFFLWLLEGDALQQYSRERGSFRGYVKVLLRGFVSHDGSARDAVKRGGRVRTFSLDKCEVPLADPNSPDPEAAFDKSWVKEVIRIAVDRVRDRLISSGRESHFRIYEKYEMAPEAARPTYESIASELGIKVSDVRNRLFAAREMVRNELRVEIAGTTQGGKELEDEWHDLFGP